MGLSKPFNFVNIDELVRDWLEDYFFVIPEHEDEEDIFGEHLPGICHDTFFFF